MDIKLIPKIAKGIRIEKQKVLTCIKFNPISSTTRLFPYKKNIHRNVHNIKTIVINAMIELANNEKDDPLIR